MKWDEDLAHRTLWTFVQTFTGMLVATSLLDLDVTLLSAALAAAIADVLVVVKEYARYRLNGADNGTNNP
jgi:hypothetical protein